MMSLGVPEKVRAVFLGGRGAVERMGTQRVAGMRAGARVNASEVRAGALPNDRGTKHHRGDEFPQQSHDGVALGRRWSCFRSAPSAVQWREQASRGNSITRAHSMFASPRSSLRKAACWKFYHFNF